MNGTNKLEFVPDMFFQVYNVNGWASSLTRKVDHFWSFPVTLVFLHEWDNIE
jgi:hypothetical protein